jgi:DNA polymerase-3 subunit delta
VTLEELEAELRAGRLRPAYLLLGEEPLLQEEALEALRKAVLEGASAEFDADRLDGATTTSSGLMDALRTLPVLAPRRLVWLREPGGGREASRALLDALPDAIRDLSESRSVLVVTSREPRQPAWARSLQGAAAVVSCNPPRGIRDLVSFVRREARRQGISLEKGATERLTERIGPQLLMLRNELAKAALLAGEDGRVTTSHIAQAASDVAEEPIWELTDAIGEGRAGDALTLLGRMVSAGVAPPLLLGSLASHFRKLVRLRSGGSVPGPPRVTQKLGTQAHRYTLTRLLNALGAIHQTDENLKGRGGLDAELVLERLVLGLAA